MTDARLPRLSRPASCRRRRCPNLFFSELLPLIDNLAELKVTLHLFWLIGKKSGALRYARLDELLGDDRLLTGLAATPAAGEDVLRDALERAVARGTLLHLTVRRGDATEEWYMVNSANGREVLERLRAGELDLLVDVARGRAAPGGAAADLRALRAEHRPADADDRRRAARCREALPRRLDRRRVPRGGDDEQAQLEVRAAHPGTLAGEGKDAGTARPTSPRMPKPASGITCPRATRT